MEQRQHFLEIVAAPAQRRHTGDVPRLRRTMGRGLGSEQAVQCCLLPVALWLILGEKRAPSPSPILLAVLIPASLPLEPWHVV
jgi:hypothetical protein